jgi:hypothetical protein
MKSPLRFPVLLILFLLPLLVTGVTFAQGTGAEAGDTRPALLLSKPTPTPDLARRTPTPYVEGHVSAVLAGPGLGGGGNYGDVTLYADTAFLQVRFNGCDEGFAIRQVNEDGSVVCQLTDNTIYSAGDGLLLDGTVFSADPAYVQRRVVDGCAEGYAIRQVDADGSVVCQLIDNTTYSAGDGLLLDGAVFSADPDYVQRRVVDGCAEGYAIRQVDADGSVVCQLIDNTTYSAGNQLELAGATFNVLEGSGSGLDADLLDGQHGSDYHNASNIDAGTLGTGYYSAYSDLNAENYLGDAAGDLALNNGTLQATLNADLLDGLSSGSFWTLGGNTVGATGVLGTSDNYPLEFWVNGSRVLRLEPDATSPNIIGGYIGNWLTSGVYGATIGGGGQSGYLNRVTDNHGTVAGGYNNQAGDNDGTTSDKTYATVGGGETNTANGKWATVGGGSQNTASNNYNVVGGGNGNTASGGAATVGGGAGNAASGTVATVSGGAANIASGYTATVPGGMYNTAQGDYSLAAGLRAKANHNGSFVWADSINDSDFASIADNEFAVRARGGVRLLTGNGALRLEPDATSPNIIGGYSGNWVTPLVYGATISGGGQGGALNRVTDNHGTVAGGYDNQAGDNAGNAFDASYATVSGGKSNKTSGNYATVGGGSTNTASGPFTTIGGGNSSNAGGLSATVGGGNNNNAGGTSATVGGGNSNIASNSDTTVGGGHSNNASGQYATVGGGYLNPASGYGATVGGGVGNNATGLLNPTVGGGYANTASGSYATVSGGGSNFASGSYATVPGGGANNAQGNFSLAAGYRAKANNPGCFVWGDSTEADITCSTDNRWVARTSGGAYFYTNSALTSGVYVPAGGGAWSSVSDRNMKNNFTAVDSEELLSRLAAIPISTWNYKSQDASIRHIGPMAQDFYAAFSLGDSDKAISTLDTDGVALAGVQGLYQRSEKQAEQITQLQRENTTLRERLDAIEKGGGVQTAGASLPLGGLAPMAFGLLGVLAGVYISRRGRQG